MLNSIISAEQMIRYIICAEQMSTEYFDRKIETTGVFYMGFWILLLQKVNFFSFYNIVFKSSKNSLSNRSMEKTTQNFINNSEITFCMYNQNK